MQSPTAIPSFASARKTWRQLRSTTLVVAGVILTLWLASSAPAQSGLGGNFGTLGGVEPTGRYPNSQYYIGLDVYRSGDLEQAIEIFDSALRSGRRDIRGRWIDSIPALAMLAECHYQLGNLAAAKEHTDHVFQIAIRNRGWLGRVDWSMALQQGVTVSTPTRLWSEVNAVRVLPINDKIMYRSGQPLTEQALRAGGEIEEMNIRAMDIVEIMRGLAIASYRRRVILGPLAEQESLATGLLESIKYPAGLQIPVARALIGSMRGTGYLTTAEDKRAMEEGAENSIFNGGVHPLSAITTLSQIWAAAGSEKSSAVLSTATDLVHASAALQQPEWIGEALQLAAGCADRDQAAQVRQLASQVAGAMVRESRLAALHSLIAGADAAVTAGDLDSAVSMLSQADALSSRRDVWQPRLDAYAAYVRARVAAARGSSIGVAQSTDVDEALSRVSSFALNHRLRRQSLISMPRLYQLAMIRQSIGTTLGGATSDELLKAYCGDSPPELWRRDPVDALSGVIVDRTDAHMARISLAVSAGYAEKTVQAIDAMLAARFLSRLPLGGRLTQVRSLSHRDDALLPEAAVDFRKNAGPLIKDLRAEAAAMADPDVVQLQSLDSKACAAALSRISLPHVVPPLLDEKMPVAQLPSGTGLLTYTFVGNKLLGTLSADGKTVMWNIGAAARVNSEIGKLLRGIGVGKSRGKRLPEDDNWKENALVLRRLLLPDPATVTADQFEKLVIVPDGPLWYLPFELLPLGEEETTLLGDAIAIHYAPTPGMALKPVAPPPTRRAIGVAASQFFAPRDLEVNQTIVESILETLEEPVSIGSDDPRPTGLLGGKVGHLVIAAPLVAMPRTPLMLTLATQQRGSPFDTLAGWLRCVGSVPRNVVLCGLRTPVDYGQMGTGEEIFATLCGLHVAGVRSVLISRWAVGGESTAIALKEFLPELPYTGMKQAWMRSMLLLWRTELNPMAEPLLIQAEHDRTDVTGREPLFWAGYLVSSPLDMQPSPAEAAP